MTNKEKALILLEKIEKANTVEELMNVITNNHEIIVTIGKGKVASIIYEKPFSHIFTVELCEYLKHGIKGETFESYDSKFIKLDTLTYISNVLTIAHYDSREIGFQYVRFSYRLKRYFDYARYSIGGYNIYDNMFNKKRILKNNGDFLI